MVTLFAIRRIIHRKTEEVVCKESTAVHTTGTPELWQIDWGAQIAADDNNVYSRSISKG